MLVISLSGCVSNGIKPLKFKRGMVVEKTGKRTEPVPMKGAEKLVSQASAKTSSSTNTVELPTKQVSPPKNRLILYYVITVPLLTVGICVWICRHRLKRWFRSRQSRQTE